MNDQALLTLAAASALLVSASVGFFACDGATAPPQSGEYETGELSIYARADGNGLQVLVTASVAADGLGAELGAGDELWVEDASGASARLEPVQAGYAAMIDTSASEVDLVLRRASGEVRGALQLPEPFALEVEVTEGELGDTIDLSWPASTDGATAWFVVYGPCLTTPLQRGLSADVGAYALQPGEVAIDPSLTPCTLSVELHRDGAPVEAPIGDPSARWSGGQVRTAALEVRP